MAFSGEFALNYITERIIAISFDQACPEQTYLHNLHNIFQMLQSKHSDNYLAINLTEPREELRRMTTRLLDFGWPEQHAPTLHLLCSLCKSMENWLKTHSEHVLLLHCRGAKDRIGVVISSYVSLPSISNSEEQALDCYSMKRFYNDKMASLMIPSQKRYVQMFGKLLTHQLKINSSPLLFHCITLHHIPNFHQTVCGLFVRVYQGMQAVCTTAVHQVPVGQRYKVYFVLEPPQLLKGDIMIVCYHKNVAKGTRETVFRIQFHTGTVHGYPLLFYKKDLDLANKDSRFPEKGEVEIVFSESMTNIPGFPQGSVGWKNNSAVVIDYDTLDPLVRWDSYENITVEAQLNEYPASSLSSDLGPSNNSQRTGAAETGLQSQIVKSTAGGNMETGQLPPNILTSEFLIATDGGQRQTLLHLNSVFHGNGEVNDAQRETDILDDEENHIPSAIVTGCKEAGHAHPALPSIPSTGSGHFFTQSSDAADGMSSCSRQMLMHSLGSSRHQTHTWMKHKQQVPTDSYTCSPSDIQESRVAAGLKSEKGNSTLPTDCSAEAEKDDEFDSLALDIDQSIEQLNQLILDLDPEFEPVPTRAREHKISSGSLCTIGVGHSSDQSKSYQSGWSHEQISGISNQPEFRSPVGDLSQPLPKPAIYSLSQCGDVYDGDTVDYMEFTSEADRSLWVDLNHPPSTPAFPVTPPTPYESQRFMDNMKHSPMSSDGDLYHSEMISSPSSCQRGFGSMRSMTTSSPLPPPDSPILAHSWLDSGSNTPRSHYTPQPSPPLTLSTPNARSSHALPSILSVGSLELSLQEAMEGLESVGLNGTQLPLIPQKKITTDRSLNLSFSHSERGASSPSPDLLSSKPDNVKFVQDTSKFWYKPDISREQAISMLKDKEPGTFIVRDSHSFRGAYGLAMKVSTPPPSVLHQSKNVGELTNELVRHFLIECTQKGVRLKGCPNEPYFGSLTALVCQHSITQLALPCKLIIPDRDPLEALADSQSQTSTNSATELLKQGAACNVWFLGSVELESLTGIQAVQKATTMILSQDPPNTSTVVHFKVSAQGITLTDNQRKLFFRKHYAVNTVIFCSLDPQNRKWTRDGCLTAKVFGFVARKSGSSTENVCHLFAEHDPEQPASAIVNFVSKVMIGSQKTK